MDGLKVEELNLTDEQKSGAANLSEEQEVKIQDTVDFEPLLEGEDPSKEPEKKDPEKKEPEIKTEEKKVDELTTEQQAEQDTENQRIADKAEELKITPEKVIETEAQEKLDKETADATKKQDEEAETERLTKKAEELGKTVEEVQETEKQESEAVEQKRIEAIAKEENISVDQVKEMEKADKEIVDRHQSDPMKLARAVRTQQKAHAKLENEHEALKTSVEKQQGIINEEEFNAQCEDKRETIIQKYRVQFPEQAESDDDVVFEKGKALLKTKWDTAITDEKKAVSVQAKDKRKELVDGLPDDVKKEFLSDIEESLETIPDKQVLSKKFKIDYIVQIARGAKYTPEYIKKIGDDAYIRGKENRKIVRTMNGPKSPPPSSKKGAVTTTLNEEQKQRAREMYTGTNMTEQQMYDEFEKIKDNDF